ncbi:MAG: alpha-amylase family glycosyl hydrolase [Kiritimatiellia bacterium]|jgi:glycosidase|nr:alpha-amylase family glycosyl hydrolase [Kiritimatiellia bacterium]MDP6629592.1 alpha-amylase family glycosyl hydrolase [Kiritimatiellia bacterium]MDP6809299.1 alpha-amylase family glycosyl hydrolase [Kiritimatiellia bacterium]MDP7023037.1 alpha-amylase family glycosyl hydrolase [Kiritimatiellia bacterium]
MVECQESQHSRAKGPSETVADNQGGKKPNQTLHVRDWHPTADYRREFHVARPARDAYQISDSLFSLRGRVLLPNFKAARLLAQRMNEKRDLQQHPDQAVRAGQLNALSLLHEMMHLMIVAYREANSPDLLGEALEWTESELPSDDVEATLLRFADQFPVVDVYRGNHTAADYLAGSTGDEPHRHEALEEMLLLWMGNINPAGRSCLELFDDDKLEHDTDYPDIIDTLRTFFEGQPGLGPGKESLFDLLEAPIKASPDSLAGQLEYIRDHWGDFLGQRLDLLSTGLDLIREEEKPVFHGPGPSHTPDYAGLDEDHERYSNDLDWMPNVVMLAKNAYVWLDQLSRQYEQDLQRLDQIPDAELDRLATSGFNGLWLIGLWERSRASRRIKQKMGNPEAVASAYSLYDYVIADDLGGHAAYENLRDRAAQRGIRLASDMVPNHMGIDSRAVIEHPDWFISLDHSPFPSYTFNGPDLCEDDRVGIYLEDHYYDHSDAAVVFKRVDNQTGDTRYIYHGNDGTSMAWNDTAQLNYLVAEVREAVIQTILHVARHFPIIRFDAAMTLAKKHYQRLWFPEPGSGGDIASRSEFGMTKAEFDRVFPVEFWRDVVDRVQAEVPDTLLLAEAFWMTEGYFVRTLGMHRVYNSAFMNMLKAEDNAQYRSLIKKTLEFDPEILKRYVNFMNNPDEETAVAQFGSGDKYFGVCVLMATMPGLPMFGHGQIEGFQEKYGMEYRRAYWDETPDPWLVERHEEEIFPLLHRRWLFAEVAHFLIYDFYTEDGHVNEDVFAFSNRAGDARALVVYHNRYADTRGRISRSAATMVKQGDGTRQLAQQSLAEGLDLPADEDAYVIFREHVSGLEYVRPCTQIHGQGFHVELGGFTCKVFMDFRIMYDEPSGPYASVTDRLGGHGVPSIEQALNGEDESSDAVPAPSPDTDLSSPGAVLEPSSEQPGVIRRMLRYLCAFLSRFKRSKPDTRSTR